MRIFVPLLSRLLAVAVVCLAGSVVWSMIDARRSLEREIADTADRTGQHIEALYWQELLWRGGVSKERILPTPEWRTLQTLALISPGVCVDFRFAQEEPERLCGQIAGVGSPAPAWFAAAYDWMLGTHQDVSRPLSERQRNAGVIIVAPEPQAAVRMAWQRLSSLAAMATALTLAISLFSAVAIAQALAPARGIIAGLRRLSAGDYRSRVALGHARDFAPLGAAVNELADRLALATSERIDLTRRLIEAREEERRDLARELHDEFGQCLAAGAAFAGAIELGAARDRPDVAQDAREIGRLFRRMSSALRTALTRLRNPVSEEIGLEAGLLELVAGCNARGSGVATVRLDLEGDLTNLPERIASGVYRIAQESLTNALRHGAPSEVCLRVERSVDQNEAIMLTIEDDGGGDATRIAAAGGQGIAGMRERVAAFGGEFSIRNGARGVRVAAVIPLALAA